MAERDLDPGIDSFAAGLTEYPARISAQVVTDANPERWINYGVVGSQFRERVVAQAVAFPNVPGSTLR